MDILDGLSDIKDELKKPMQIGEEFGLSEADLIRLDMLYRDLMNIERSTYFEKLAQEVEDMR